MFLQTVPPCWQEWSRCGRSNHTHNCLRRKEWQGAVASAWTGAEQDVDVAVDTMWKGDKISCTLTKLQNLNPTLGKRDGTKINP